MDLARPARRTEERRVLRRGRAVGGTGAADLVELPVAHQGGRRGPELGLVVGSDLCGAARDVPDAQVVELALPVHAGRAVASDLHWQAVAAGRSRGEDPLRG